MDTPRKGSADIDIRIWEARYLPTRDHQEDASAMAEFELQPEHAENERGMPKSESQIGKVTIA
jgi:hypothetical protein